ncbi:hypothetical protein QBC34DRAFT_377877 [Podospora aff. communis PSN243]|uniref:Uncharacterized protein n=1 Tax=Podospora aff. communis PSN243 TaxID=3040156 RepID=A0AAV9GVD2_9PEZI|nr:hypothetical protein QBC34DRAFT_377877 [Podospora aff. communis PSN243]
MPTSSLSPSQLSLRERDTGFPEYFHDRTTSLPHPDANLSPDACLTEDDINISRAEIRHRMSILVGRDRSRALTAGSIPNSPQEAEELFCNSPVLMNETSNLSTIGRLAFTSLHGAELTKQLGSDEPRSSKDGHSFASTTGSSGENSPTHSHSPTDLPRRRESRRSRFFKKLTRR